MKKAVSTKEYVTDARLQTTTTSDGRYRGQYQGNNSTTPTLVQPPDNSCPGPHRTKALLTTNSTSTALLTINYINLTETTVLPTTILAELLTTKVVLNPAAIIST